VQDNDNLIRELRESFVNGYKEFKLRSDDYDDFYRKMELFIQTLKDKNALTEEGQSQMDEWQQLSEAEFQLDWLNKFKKQYVTE
jgi:ATP-dependent DNA helicase RecQ